MMTSPQAALQSQNLTAARDVVHATCVRPLRASLRLGVAASDRLENTYLALLLRYNRLFLRPGAQMKSKGKMKNMMKQLGALGGGGTGDMGNMKDLMGGMDGKGGPKLPF